MRWRYEAKQQQPEKSAYAKHVCVLKVIATNATNNYIRLLFVNTNTSYYFEWKDFAEKAFEENCEFNLYSSKVFFMFVEWPFNQKTAAWTQIYQTHLMLLHYMKHVSHLRFATLVFYHIQLTEAGRKASTIFFQLQIIVDMLNLSFLICIT